MSQSCELRVFVLNRAHGSPNERPLQDALTQAGMAAAPLTEAQWPVLAARLRARGADAVVVLSAGAAGGQPRHWLDAPHARGWITAESQQHTESLLPAWKAHLAQGHVAADAALLAWPALPRLSWGEGPASEPTPSTSGVAASAPLGLYAIAETAEALRSMVEAGVRTVQLRIKRPADGDAAWEAGLRSAIRDSVSAAEDHGALLFINDHWRLAAELGAPAAHLGQEDLLALGNGGRAELRATGLALGVSSHAVWELCRARTVATRYIACGPVWPTITKAMPWRPQGLDNLAWWRRVAGAPVVAIGGILTPERVREAAATGVSGVCIVRGLGSDPQQTVPILQQAFEDGRQEASAQASEPVQRPHPTLERAA